MATGGLAAVLAPPPDVTSRLLKVAWPKEHWRIGASMAACQWSCPWN
jgi:hypothetical protein